MIALIVWYPTSNVSSLIFNAACVTTITTTFIHACIRVHELDAVDLSKFD